TGQTPCDKLGLWASDKPLIAIGSVGEREVTLQSAARAVKSPQARLQCVQMAAPRCGDPTSNISLVNSYFSVL
ncbi:hypothetical protein JZ751_012079, partial [Albula glossodonta]